MKNPFGLMFIMCFGGMATHIAIKLVQDFTTTRREWPVNMLQTLMKWCSTELGLLRLPLRALELGQSQGKGKDGVCRRKIEAQYGR